MSDGSELKEIQHCENEEFDKIVFEKAKCFSKYLAYIYNTHGNKTFWKPSSVNKN